MSVKDSKQKKLLKNYCFSTTKTIGTFIRQTQTEAQKSLEFELTL